MPTLTVVPASPPTPAAPTMPDRYHFSADWFSHHIPNWRRHLAHLHGRAGVRYLEIGVYEGRSFFWLLEHVLTAPSARATAVDAFFPHDPDYEATFLANLAACPTRAKVDVVKGDTADVLRNLPLASQDLIYIDAGHGQRALFIDLALAWGLLAEGGLMILDDYALGTRRLPPGLRPQPVIDVFLSAMALELEVVHRDYQLVLRRVPSRSDRAGAHLPPYMRDTCTPIGDWFYFWQSHRLVRADGSDELLVHRRLRPAFEAALRAGRGMSWLARALALRSSRRLKR